MSIETRKTRQGTSFTIRYRDSQGNQHRETLGLKEDGWDRRKARAEEHRRLAEKTLASPPLADVAWEWFHGTAPQAAWKPRTLRAYKRSIARLEPLHDMRVRELRPKHVAEWISKHPYSAKTTNDDISVLHSIFDYAIRHELVEANPVTAAPRPKIGRKKWRILTPEEIQAVDREFTDEKARLMFRVLTRTGMRRGELRNLRIRDIDFDRCVIRVTDAKTDEGIRSIAIPRSLAAELKEWCEHA